MTRQTIDTMQTCLTFNRERTLGLLDQIAELPDPQAALAWRPGAGRAHLAWQLMHIGITEELFATERMSADNPPAFADLVPRFRGGSTPDDDVPSVDDVRRVLTESRQHLTDTFAVVTDADLDTIPDPLTERGWNLGKVLHVLNWHEAHHQGQAHAVLNLYKAQQ